MRYKSIKSLCEYVREGNHAFVSCETAAARTHVLDRLQEHLAGIPVQHLAAETISSLEDFGRRYSTSCQDLVAQIGSRITPRSSVSGWLQAAMVEFEEAGRQGALLISGFDNIVSLQRTFEVEGALRSVMQMSADVAVVIFATEKTLVKIGQDDRPFYLSFPIFRPIVD